jgi:zinc finger CCCH domain-containing protein 13
MLAHSTEVNEDTQNMSDLPTASHQPLLSLLKPANGNNAIATPSELPAALSNHTTFQAQDSVMQRAQGPNERTAPDPIDTQFTPPVGSRLLAFARPQQASKPENGLEQAPLQSGMLTFLKVSTQLTFLGSNPVRSPPLGPTPDSTQQLISKLSNMQPFIGYAPNEEQPTGGLQEFRREDQRRPTLVQAPFTPPPDQNLGQESPTIDQVFPNNKGSRFAKFFDGKGKEPGPLHVQPHMYPPSSSPGPGPIPQGRNFVSNNNFNGGSPDPRTMDDIYAMLSNSEQVPITNTFSLDNER